MSASYLHFQCAVFSINYFKTTTQEKLKTIFKVLNHKISEQLSRIILLHVKIFRFFPPNILKLIIVLFMFQFLSISFQKVFLYFFQYTTPIVALSCPQGSCFKQTWTSRGCVHTSYRFLAK